MFEFLLFPNFSASGRRVQLSYALCKHEPDPDNPT